jgi:IS30 family transposase
MKEENNNKNEEDIVLRLDIIIGLMLGKKQELNTRDKIEKLKGVGLSYREIAKILGRKETYISKEMSLMKKERKKHKKDIKNE